MRECGICGNSIVGMSIRAKYCSPACRSEANKKRSREYTYKHKPTYNTKTVKNKGLIINHWVIGAIVTSSSTLRDLSKSTGIEFKKDLVKVPNRPVEMKEVITLKDITMILKKLESKNPQIGTVRSLKKLEEALKSQEYMGRKFDIEYQRIIE